MNFQQLTEAYHLPVYNRYPITLVKGKGAYVWDENGNKYLDALAGIAVNSLGHCHPKVVTAIQKQASELMHISNFYYSKQQAKLLELLIEISGMDYGFLCNSGAEAMEACIKVARKYGEQHHKKGPLITISNAFHGRTLGTISMGMKKYSEGYDPLLSGFHEIPLNDMSALESAFTESTLGVVVEPIQGSGGLRTASKEFMQKIQSLCQQHDALFIVDEVQTGMGRTGRLFGYEHTGVQPDIIGIAKAMGGGFPIGGMLCRKKVGKALNYGDHGSTYGGNPLACAASIAAINALIEDNLASKAQKKGTILKENIQKKAKDCSFINDIRGMGLMIGVELSCNGRSVVEEMMKQGVLSNCTQGNVIRLVPPLVIGNRDLELLASTLVSAIKDKAPADS